MGDAVHDNAPPPAEADLQLHLLPVGMLADAPARRHRLKAHGDPVEAGAARKEHGVGMTVGGHGLPVWRPLSRLHDDGPTAHRLGWIHGPKLICTRPSGLAR